MRGDRVICRTCGSIFRTIEIVEDSRKNRYRPSCPYCRSFLTTNIEPIVEMVAKRGWKKTLNSKKLQKIFSKEQLWDVYENKDVIKTMKRKTPKIVKT